MSKTNESAAKEEQGVEQAAQPAQTTTDKVTTAETPPIEEQKAKQATPQAAKTKATKAVTVYVLCAGNVGGQRFDAGVVVEGMPEDVAKAHAAMLDPHPAAVEHAKGAGAQVLPYGEA